MASKKIVLENFKEATFHGVYSDGENFVHKHLEIDFLARKIRYAGDLERNKWPFPLVGIIPIEEFSSASPPFNITTEGMIVDGFRGEGGGKILVLASSKGYVRIIHSDGTKTDLGTPAALSPRLATTIKKFADKVVLVHPGTSLSYYKPLSGGTWTSFGSFQMPIGCETFKDRIYITNGLDIFKRNVIKIFNSSFVEIGSLNIGEGWTILDLKNIQNRWLGIFAQNTSDINKPTYLFLWRGEIDSSYDYAVQLSGIYLNSTNYLSTFLVFLETSQFEVSVFELVGIDLKLIKIFPFVFPRALRPRGHLNGVGAGFWERTIDVFDDYLVFKILKRILKPTDYDASYLIFWNILRGELYDIYLPVFEPPQRGYGLNGFFVIKVDQTEGTFVYIGDDDEANTGHRLWRQQLFKHFASSPPSKIFYQSNDFYFPYEIQIQKLEIFYHKYFTGTGNELTISIEGLNEFKGEINPTNKWNGTLQNTGDYAIFSNIGAIVNSFNVSIKGEGLVKRVVIHYEPLLSKT